MPTIFRLALNGSACSGKRAASSTVLTWSSRSNRELIPYSRESVR